MKFSCKESKATKEEQVKKYVVCVILVLASLSTVRAQQTDQPDPQTTIQTAPDWQHQHFEVSSTTFKNNTTMPLSTIYNYLYKGVNVCSLNGMPGGDESPELSWTNAPRRTRSFVVTAFDVTAGVTHWGMYNISAATTELPENAGVTGSSYGKQVINTYGSAGSNADRNYGGPCPPADYPPNVHHYVFTVYALDEELQLPSSTDFPPTALTLFRALVAAGQDRHILASASITGLYSTTPTSE